MLTEWPPSDARSDRERIDRARREAENLFKPRQQTSPAEAAISAASPGSSGSSAEHQPQRLPRIFRISPAAPTAAPIAAASSQAGRRPLAPRRTVKRAAVAIPASQYGRVCALASYGMTQAQVAELYGVGVDEIERIIRLSNSTHIA